MGAVEVTLPGGVAIGGQWYRSAWLNAVTGHEEEFLMGEGRFLSTAARMTRLLASCLQRLGPMQPVDAEMVRQLRVGDRECLLLHLRRLTLGDRVSCLLHCPHCQKKMDLDLSIGELLLPPYSWSETFHQITISEGETSYQVVFRPPNGEDQEAVAALAADSVTSAAELLVRRCIEQVTSAGGEALSAVSEGLLREVSGRMVDLDPQAEILLDLPCPECGTRFVVPFDIADYLCQELGDQERGFYRGVHDLSFHYHWDEAAILKLDRRKRHIYVELLADEMSGGAKNR